MRRWPSKVDLGGQEVKPRRRCGAAYLPLVLQLHRSMTLLIGRWRGGVRRNSKRCRWREVTNIGLDERSISENTLDTLLSKDLSPVIANVEVKVIED